ncbi:MAG: Holliday junction resolvase [Methanobrevibacter sp.]|jgi:Holliday junction resolvase|nr:Holliday junction resolvase [Candidatus Methanoflexus mossambicus]
MTKKGTAEERDLVSKLWKLNFAAMRAPASGAATKHSIPDVIAGNGKIYLGIEVKTTVKEIIYIDSSQIEGLIDFCDIFGAKPFLGLKFKRTKWLFLSPKNVPRTKKGNYKVTKDFAIEKALELDEILGIDKQIKF